MLLWSEMEPGPIRRHKGKGAREVSRKDWPQLVTFGDVSDPASERAMRTMENSGAEPHGNPLKSAVNLVL